MPRRRDRATATGLLPLMEARPHKDGVTVTAKLCGPGREEVR